MKILEILLRSQEVDYTTVCLLDYPFFQENYLTF